MKEAFEVRIKPNWDIPTGAEIDDEPWFIHHPDNG